MKIVKTLLTFIFFILVISVVSIVYLVKFNNENYPGSAVKEEFLKYSYLVNLAGLNEPGDYRYYYTSSEYPQIQVQLVSQREVAVDERSAVWISELIKDTTGKSIMISFDKDELPQKELYSDQDLNNIRDKLETGTKEPTLYVVYLSKYKESKGLAGITLHKDTIFIFKKAIEELNTNPELIQRLEQSTIMHEWAHLLGVDHTDNEDCIMSEKIHVNQNPNSWKGFIPIEYCSSTKKQIKELFN